MRVTALTTEVIVASEPLVRVGSEEIRLLKRAAEKNERRRMRLCAHPHVDSPIQEMIIALARGIYIRPHKHPKKSESLHVIEGKADVVFFDDSGTIRDVLSLTAMPSQQGVHYYRLESPWFHTLWIRSRVFVFHETINGPFRHKHTQFAPWSPDENAARLHAKYLKTLSQQINSFRRKPS